jgi:hypothetical protein
VIAGTPIIDNTVALGLARDTQCHHVIVNDLPPAHRRPDKCDAGLVRAVKGREWDDGEARPRTAHNPRLCDQLQRGIHPRGKAAVRAGVAVMSTRGGATAEKGGSEGENQPTTHRRMMAPFLFWRRPL